jgi:hypothetical protein
MSYLTEIVVENTVMRNVIITEELVDGDVCYINQYGGVSL